MPEKIVWDGGMVFKLAGKFSGLKKPLGFRLQKIIMNDDFVCPRIPASFIDRAQSFY
jgi:hypothetical protein